MKKIIMTAVAGMMAMVANAQANGLSDVYDSLHGFEQSAVDQLVKDYMDSNINYRDYYVRHFGDPAGATGYNKWRLAAADKIHEYIIENSDRVKHLEAAKADLESKLEYANERAAKYKKWWSGRKKQAQRLEQEVAAAEATIAEQNAEIAQLTSEVYDLNEQINRIKDAVAAVSSDPSLIPSVTSSVDASADIKQSRNGPTIGADLDVYGDVIMVGKATGTITKHSWDTGRSMAEEAEIGIVWIEEIRQYVGVVKPTKMTEDQLAAIEYSQQLRREKHGDHIYHEMWENHGLYATTDDGNLNWVIRNMKGHSSYNHALDSTQTDIELSTEFVIVTNEAVVIIAGDNSHEIGFSEEFMNAQVDKVVLEEIARVAEEAYEAGYSDGYEDGYADGYADGFADGVASVQNAVK